MPRPKKQFKDPKQQKAHEARLAKRRQNHARAQGLKLAEKAAEAEGIDFQALVETEKQRMETAVSTQARHAGSQSPKVTSKARDDMAMAFELMGGVPALVVWGRMNPTEFYRIWARLIPRPAEDASQAMPLEALLEKLASREEMSVRDAARDIGEELMEKGRKQADIEDAQWEPVGSA